ncbi:MAG: hypothetical protein LBG59_02825 [Candidatus Peribacteria bacterium]|jgi:23S rRNA (adenine2503-C2)-methyltransferase|nr:hypothetical protein [Candidatus Peribacteria bacterium]
MPPSVLFDTSALQSWAKAHQLPSFKVKQIFFELFKNQRIHREEMTTLSKDLKADLAKTFTPLSLSVVETVATDTTTKFAFQTHDGHLIEAILMFHWQDEKYVLRSQNSLRKVAGRKLNRITLCISSQVGCPVNCLFCVTGKLGFTRNLSWDEIISQILYANRWVQQQF